jgi:O-antigen/teichoic acid export membrane protein
MSGTMVQATVQLAVVVILTRLLSASDFGLFSAALIVVSFSELFSQLGVGPAIVQRPQLDDSHVRTGFTIVIAFAVAVAWALWLIAPFLATILQMPQVTPILRSLLLAFPVTALGTVAESLLLRELRFRRLATVQTTSYVFGYGLIGVAMASLGFGVWALVGAHLGQRTVKTGALLLLRRHRVCPQFHREAFNELMSFGGGLTIARLANYIAGQGDQLVVARFLGASALGVYGRAHQLAVMPLNLLGAVFDRVLFPTMASFQHEQQQLADTYRRTIMTVATVTLPVSGLLILVGYKVVYVLYGQSWIEVAAPFQIMTAGMLFRATNRMSDSLARSTGAVYRRAWRQVLFAGLVVCGAFIGQIGGISGVALSVLAATAVNFILMLHLCFRLTSLKWHDYRLSVAPTLISILVACTCSLAISNLLQLVSAPAPFVAAIPVAAYAVTAIAFFRLANFGGALPDVSAPGHRPLRGLASQLTLAKARTHHLQEPGTTPLSDLSKLDR